ncbi:MAG: UDP-N-acetylmuramoyl-tripeptide--D-alanyl-D-alanine ligase [Leeuwenhoekiella sp.]
MTIEELHLLFLKSSGVCTDTRKIAKNNLFFALSGENFDGNTFAQKAIENGAFRAIIDDSSKEFDGKTILVDDTLKTLQDLAIYHRKYLNLPIIALTGSNGKTTTKELINAVLSKKYKVTATQGNLNNHIGVPLTLLSITTDTEIGIVEMGANHIGEIDSLCKIATPDFGLITNFGKAHLEGFGSEAGVVQGKSELYKNIASTGGKLFVNIDDDKQVQLTEKIPHVTFGTKDNSDVVLHYPPASPFAEIIYKNEHFPSQLTGFYNATNMAAALTIGLYFEVEVEDIQEAITEYFPSNNRSQIKKIQNLTLLLDAYNANPTSMVAALINFKGLQSTHKIAILGDMFELGTSAAAEHLSIAELALSQKCDVIVFVGENFTKTNLEHENIYFFKDIPEMKNNFPERIKDILKEDTLILIKGSRGMALENIVPTLETIVSK